METFEYNKTVNLYTVSLNKPLFKYHFVEFLTRMKFSVEKNEAYVISESP